MVTLSKMGNKKYISENVVGAVMDFDLLSTDTKPTGTWEGVKILNGSSCFEMNTQDVKFYDETSQSWV